MGCPNNALATRPQLLLDHAFKPDRNFVGAFGGDKEHAALPQTSRPANGVAVITDAERSSTMNVFAVPHCPEASPWPVSGISSLTSQERRGRL